MAIKHQIADEPVVKPDCRYGHGLLILLTYEGGHSGWTAVAAHGNTTFRGHIYICKTCGYTEFFDDDIALTRGDLEQANDPS